MKAVLVFIDGTICDRSAQLGLLGERAFYERDAIMADAVVPGSVACLRELATRYRIVYMGARPAWSRSATEEWLEASGFPLGPVHLAATHAERLAIVRRLRDEMEFAAGIGDRWDDNELHLELGCLSIILKEHAGDWDTVRRHLLGARPK